MKISKFIPQNIKSILGKTKYNIGFINGDPIDYIHKHQTIDNIKWLDLNGYNYGWFADPFILEITDRVIKILAEEYVYKNSRGRISLLTIDRHNLKLMDISVTLELPTHLSFPYIIRQNGKTYIMPENCLSGCLTIYEFDIKSNRCLNPVIIIDEPLIDAQYLRINDKSYIFAQNYADGIMLKDRKEYVYVADDLLSEYRLLQILEDNMPELRGAGSIIESDNKIIRPTQSCLVNYGHETIFKEVFFYGTQFSEKEIGRLAPNRRGKMPLQLHTFNSMDNYIVVDGNRYTNEIIHQITKISNR